MSDQYYNILEEYKLKFMQVPKVFFTNPQYIKMSNNSKLLYSILYDRLQLSIKNNWLDDDGNIYFIFRSKDLEQLLNISKRKMSQLKNELIEHNLLRQKQIGFNKAYRLYLLKPVVTKEDIYKIDNLAESSRGADSATLKESPSNKDSHRGAESATPEGQILPPNDTELSDTKDFKDSKDTKNQFNNSFNLPNLNSEQQTVLDDFLIQGINKKYSLNELFGEYFVNILLAKSSSSFEEYHSTVKMVFHSITSAEKEKKYSLQSHMFNDTMYSEAIREDFLNTLSTVLTRIKTDHTMESQDGFFYTCFKNTATHWIDIIKNDNTNGSNY